MTRGIQVGFTDAFFVVTAGTGSMCAVTGMGSSTSLAGSVCGSGTDEAIVCWAGRTVWTVGVWETVPGSGMS